MKTIKDNTFSVAFVCACWPAALASYQQMPELFAWSPMYNYFICPEDIRINDRHAPFLIMSLEKMLWPLSMPKKLMSSILRTKTLMFIRPFEMEKILDCKQIGRK